MEEYVENTSSSIGDNDDDNNNDDAFEHGAIGVWEFADSKSYQKSNYKIQIYNQKSEDNESFGYIGPAYLTCASDY